MRTVVMLVCVVLAACADERIGLDASPSVVDGAPHDSDDGGSGDGGGGSDSGLDGGLDANPPDAGKPDAFDDPNCGEAGQTCCVNSDGSLHFCDPGVACYLLGGVYQCVMP
jgi:hypothetical protein